MSGQTWGFGSVKKGRSHDKQQWQGRTSSGMSSGESLVLSVFVEAMARESRGVRVFRDGGVSCNFKKEVSAHPIQTLLGVVVAGPLVHATLQAKVASR